MSITVARLLASLDVVEPLPGWIDRAINRYENRKTIMSSYTIEQLPSRTGVTVQLQSTGGRGGGESIDVASGKSAAEAAQALAAKLRAAADIADEWAAGQ